jgi:flagellar motor switch/type III secretory pathway protein FliN
MRKSNALPPFIIAKGSKHATCSSSPFERAKGAIPEKSRLFLKIPRTTGRLLSEQAFLFCLGSSVSESPLSNSDRFETDDPARKDFWKSLLRIQSEVAVVLAQQTLSVDRVLHFVPGIMIQFDKPCDSPLTLEVRGQKVAEGEVVKVGDKFGIRITEVCEHGEVWVPLVSKSPSDSKSASD